MWSIKASNFCTNCTRHFSIVEKPGLCKDVKPHKAAGTTQHQDIICACRPVRQEFLGMYAANEAKYKHHALLCRDGQEDVSARVTVVPATPAYLFFFLSHAQSKTGKNQESSGQRLTLRSRMCLDWANYNRQTTELVMY